MEEANIQAKSQRMVAIVGRPNVGKSALFNRLAARKISIVHDQPGVTRDRITAECRIGETPYEIMDTGGIGEDADATFTQQVRQEVDIALSVADLVLFVVDGQDGVTSVDHTLARVLRRAASNVLLVVNKIDHAKHGIRAAEFSELGFETEISVSAEHGLGMERLVDEIEARLPPYIPPEKEAETLTAPIRLAIVGRPNVGKSSLTNAIIEDNRTLVSPISGTTRDAVDIPYERGNQRFVLIDTAGIRPRGKRSESVEIFSVMRSEGSIKRADLCVLVIDAETGATAQDKKIAGLIVEARKPCVIAINKWDLIKDKTGDKDSLKEVLETIQSELFFLPYAPMVLLSAKTGEALPRLFKMIDAVRRASLERLSTGPLNRMLSAAMSAQPAGVRSGRRFKVLYATHPAPARDSAIPVPSVVLFVNDPDLCDESYKRYLERMIREQVPYTGLPLLIHMRGREKK
jgi:GTP-binding protein